jgi:hypothetical protein
MAVTANNANNEIVVWRRQAIREFRRGNRYSPYMGDSMTAIIRFYRDLEAPDGGDQVNIPFIGALNGPGVSTGPLTGNEEKMDSYGMRAWVDWARNAVLLKRSQMRKAAVDQLRETRPLLTQWGNRLQRDEITLALDALPSEAAPANLGNDTVGGQRVNGVLYSAATTAQKNTFVTHNSDRLLFGNAVSNLVAGNMASSLANVDTTNDRPTAATIRLMKSLAEAADPEILPYQEDENAGETWYVLFVGSNHFRDLAADASIIAANRDARPREGNAMDRNPLFTGGDLLFEGVIIRKIPEIDRIAVKSGAGAASANVAPMFLCGQSAVAFVWGQLPKPTERKEDDYGMLIGRGIEMVYGIAKIFRKITSTGYMKQHGVVTAYMASVDNT